MHGPNVSPLSDPLRGLGVTPDVTRPLNRAAANAIGVVSSCAAVVRYAAEAVETWLDQRGEVFDARADLNDPDLVDVAFDEDED